MADAERLRCLSAGIGESLGSLGFTHDYYTRLLLRVAKLLLDPTTQTTTTRHATHHTRTVTHFRILMHLCLALYGGDLFVDDGR